MPLSVLIELRVADVTGFVEVSINNLHQLAILMPGSVVSYEVHRIDERPSDFAVIDDIDLVDLLSRIATEIAAG